MLVLGIETATLVAGVALINEEKVISEHFINNKKTHSQNLMPMIKQVLEEGGISPEQLDGIAVSGGPGSFTGLRIGMATAKTLAQVLNIPVKSVSTLDGLANNVLGLPGIICPILDAKKNQVYTALYRTQQGEISPLTDYLAISIEELISKLQEMAIEPITFLGDAVSPFKEQIEDKLKLNYQFANQINSLPKGSSIAQLGLKNLAQDKGKENSFLDLQPLYIRRSEAEISWEKKHGSSI